MRCAKESGYEAICIGFQWPPSGSATFGTITKEATAPIGREEGEFEYAETGRNRAGPDPAATWKDLEWIKSATDLPVVAKGIMTGEDADLARRRR
jgi:isopentenyl diphosphate isomerase/L-lactate dehydrogenase-like FMN-dependent dehydrogenase